MNIPLSGLATNWTDLDGDPITLTNIDLTTANGVALTLVNVVTNPVVRLPPTAAATLWL